jgi:hypothetical protein
MGRRGPAAGTVLRGAFASLAVLAFAHAASPAVAAQAAAGGGAIRSFLAVDDAPGGGLIRDAHGRVLHVEPVLMGGLDADGNRLRRGGLKLDVDAAHGVRVGIAATRLEAADAYEAESADQLSLYGESRRWRPLRLDAEVGVIRLGASGDPVATGRIRARGFALPGGLRAELRLQRTPLVATPHLLASPVVVEDAQGRLEASLPGPFRLRSVARFSKLSAATESNRRSDWGGGLVVPVRGGLDLSGQYQETRYARPTRAGYFAPRRVQAVEAAGYAEWAIRTLEVAFDAGTGVQRVIKHDAAGEPWGPAFRFWSAAALPIHTGLALHLEAEGSNTRAGETALGAEWWHYAVTLALRWKLP